MNSHTDSTSSMKMNIFITLVFLTFIYEYETATDKVFCYYQSWSASFFPPSEIDVNICTHINFAFLNIRDDGNLGVNGDDRVLKQVSDLKKKKPNIKLIFSVGGGSAGSQTFSLVASSQNKLNTLASSALQFIQKYNFDGIDIDWEYPAQGGGKPSDKATFITLLKTLRTALKNHGNHLLTVAVESSAVDASYDVPKISEQVDFINVMTYDFHNPSDGKTGENSPLYASSQDSEWQKQNSNCDVAITNWVKKGAPSNKLILGLAFYGIAYKLKDPNQHGVGAPTVGGANIGSNNQPPYGEICKLKNGWTDAWDNEQQVPYKYNGPTWIGYDNPESIKRKVQFAKGKNLGGVLIWSVDQDDRSGSCGPKFGLLEEVKKNL